MFKKRILERPDKKGLRLEIYTKCINKTTHSTIKENIIVQCRSYI